MELASLNLVPGGEQDAEAPEMIIEAIENDI